MRATVPIAVLLTGAAGATVAAVVLPWDDPARQPAQPCVALQALDQSLDQGSLADQALIRAHAARLSDSLDRRARRLREADGVDARVAAGLRALLADPNATVNQLELLLEPVAQRCVDR